MGTGNVGMSVFAFGTLLFSVVPFLMIVGVIIAVVFLVKHSREHTRKLDDISRKMDELLKDKK